jgi:hypothetical protein
MANIAKLSNIATSSLAKYMRQAMASLGKVMGGTITGGGGGYTSVKGLRFNDTGYMTCLSNAVATDGKKSTMSLWMKLGKINDYHVIWTRGDTHSLYIDATSNKLVFNWLSGIIANVLRDTTAWMHLCIAFDSTQAVQADRLKAWINNDLVTWSTPNSITLNQVTPWFAQSSPAYFGRHYVDAWPYKGYMDDFCMIDGQALTPSSFAETNATTGAWVPKDLTPLAASSGNYGCWLKFDNATSVSTLGTDSFSKNNFTPVNMSVTAGINNDSLTDTINNNYCTLNPLDKHVSATVSKGMLYAGSIDGAGYHAGVCGTMWVTSGKWYWEVIPTAGQYWCIGITQEDIVRVISGANFGPGIGANSVGWYYNGNIFVNGGLNGWVLPYALNDVIGVAFDADNGKAWFAKNGTWQASGDPANGTNAAVTNLVGRAFAPCTSVQFTASVVAHNFGQRPFSYTPPTGFLTLCADNLTVGI